MTQRCGLTIQGLFFISIYTVSNALALMVAKPDIINIRILLIMSMMTLTLNYAHQRERINQTRKIPNLSASSENMIKLFDKAYNIEHYCEIVLII